MGRENDLNGKTICLTGGASGIGLAAAKNIYARGANVAIADVDQAALDKASSSFQDEKRVLLTKLDVSDRRGVDSWIQSVVQKFGKLDGAANCAGVIGKHHGTRKVEDLEDDQWDLIMRVNLTGMMYCLRAELQAITSPGSIVCVSSVQGTMGFAKHAAYSASKHGVTGLVRSAAKEVGERNVRVNAVAPCEKLLDYNPGIDADDLSRGSIETPLMDKAKALEGVEPGHTPTPINRLGTAEECGSLIAFLLSDESSFISGATYAIDGAWYVYPPNN